MTTTKLRYAPSSHALDQVSGRFNVETAQVAGWINAEMRNATYIQTQPNGAMVYESDVARFAIDKAGVTVITVTQLPSKLPVHTKVRQLVERQLRVAEAHHKRDSRALRIEHAKLGVEQAQLELNRELAKSPITKQQVTRKLAALAERVADVDLRQRRVDETLETERRAAKMYGVFGV